MTPKEITHLAKVTLAAALTVILFIFVKVCIAEFPGFACVENKQGIKGVIVSRRIHDYINHEYWYIVMYPFGEEAGELEENLKECPCGKVDLNNLTEEQKDFIEYHLKKIQEQYENK